MRRDAARFRLLLRRGGLVLAYVVAGAARAGAATQTTTTTFQHNGDGALTAVATHVGARPARTAYLTWDNFTPDAAAPTTGTVSAGNGNLIGVGALPGNGQLATALAYDVRNRLTGCSPAGRAAVSYAYHPASLLASSTLATGDALQFYYDNTATPRMINTSQPSTGMAASFLGPARYLSDGTEQVLFQPRKDTAGVYDAAAQSLTPYSYDPYGAPSAVSAVGTSAPPQLGSADGYDLSANPFLYAGEYRDSSCEAYYLRARWYLPEQQTFLSRDPADGLHRFSYTAGNPIGRTDPSGMKYSGMDFSRDVDKLVGRLTPGFWAYVEPVLPIWGQALGGIQLAGLLPSFWHHPTTTGYVTFGFLAASMVAEAGGELRAFDRVFSSAGRAFGARIGIDAVLGTSQTAAQSYRHGRLDVPSLVQGIETAAGGILWARLVGGVGYRPFNMTADEVDAQVTAFHAANPESGDALVFRIRENLLTANSHVGPVGRGLSRIVTGPVLDWASVGMYHEALAAIGAEDIVRNEVLADTAYDWKTQEPFDYYAFKSDETFATNQGAARAAANLSGSPKFQFVGRINAEQNVAFGAANPFGYPTAHAVDELVMSEMAVDPTPYRWLTNNSHHHVAAVLQHFNF